MRNFLLNSLLLYLGLFCDPVPRYRLKIRGQLSRLKAGQKLKVHKTFRRRLGRIANVLYKFNFLLVYRGYIKKVWTNYGDNNVVFESKPKNVVWCLMSASWLDYANRHLRLLKSALVNALFDINWKQKSNTVSRTPMAVILKLGISLKIIFL